MKKEIIVLSAIILSACVSTNETRLSDGEIGYNIDCSGYANNWVECEVQATETCRGLYTEISSTREKSDASNRSMLIVCDSES